MLLCNACQDVVPYSLACLQCAYKTEMEKDKEDGDRQHNGATVSWNRTCLADMYLSDTAGVQLGHDIQHSHLSEPRLYRNL